jgi:hypothetical protein
MQYPIHLSYDVGGCQYPEDCGELSLPSDQEDRRARCSQLRAVQRGGNNPNEWECCPQKKIVGTGCMNSSCNCKDCQGDCVCEAGGEQVEGFAVGIGLCPYCKSSDCEGRCSCDRNKCRNANCRCATPCMCGNGCSCGSGRKLVEGFDVLGRGLKFWISTFAIAYLIYYFLKCKSKK